MRSFCWKYNAPCFSRIAIGTFLQKFSAFLAPLVSPEECAMLRSWPLSLSRLQTSPTQTNVAQVFPRPHQSKIDDVLFEWASPPSAFVQSIEIFVCKAKIHRILSRNSSLSQSFLFGCWMPWISLGATTLSLLSLGICKPRSAHREYFVPMFNKIIVVFMYPPPRLLFRMWIAQKSASSSSSSCQHFRYVVRHIRLLVLLWLLWRCCLNLFCAVRNQFRHPILFRQKHSLH